jgi:hypothetical protein
VNRSQEAPVGIDVDPLETRLLPRLIAGLSEWGCAAWLGWVWLHPEYVGLDGVLAAVAVVVLEGPLLLGLLAILMYFGGAADWKQRIRLAVLFVAAMWSTFMMSRNITNMLEGVSPYLFAVLAGTFLGKWMLFKDGRGNPVFFEFAKTVVQLVAFAVCVSLATTAAPRVGFDPDTMARLGIPDLMYVGGERPGLHGTANVNGWFQPWCLIAGGMFYFLIYGAFRFLTWTRPARVRAKSRRSIL